MKIIGLTGGIGSGKSTVAKFLAELGAGMIDVDKVGHEVLSSDVEIQREVVVAFSKQILTSTGDIDRKKLGEAVFGNAGSLSRLNQIVHPRMYEVVKTKLEEYRRQGMKVVVLDAPLLVEAGWTSIVDEVWVTVASESTVLRRLRERVGLSKPESLARIRSQLSSEERIKHADVAISNEGDLDELRARVEELWQGLHTRER